MKFTETPLAGAYLVQPTPIEDPRGFFARAFCTKEFESHGLPTQFPQCNISFNLKKGTLRALHYADPPSLETKIVRCTQGAIFDVIVDVRRESPTFGKWYSVELNPENRSMLFIPMGFAHGFQTLHDNTEVFYQMGDFYNSKLSRGIRYNDPTININWPIEEKVISDQDLGHPLLSEVFKV